MSTPYVGEIRMFGFSRLPSGWLPCDGSVYAISDYEVLFMLLGTTYGGDGNSTFATPNLSGRVPLHSRAGGVPRIIGALGGSETVTLTPGQMPGHNHLMNAAATPASSDSINSGVLLGAISNDTMYTNDTTGLNGFVTSSRSTTSVGGNQPHDNLMPTLTVQICIASNGIYPQQS